ncbi:uncharacterized protein Fot_11106 [Forsythia ovata]|uniref:Uncharacterized protein n=1 Tax=Forsythia ovata TaxID=205694 RepID=A0ABD1WIS2_9LAMI
MEIHKENNIPKYYDEQEEEDTLSFSNLVIAQNNSDSVEHSPRTSSVQIDPLFEFFTGLTSQPYSNSEKNSHGKLVNEQEEDEELNEYQKRDYFATVKSHSFRKPSIYDHDHHRQKENIMSRFSSSQRAVSQSKCSGDLNYHAQRVNITSLTSMSAKSRRRMFMFGPVKFKPEMELGAIKQRQNRQVPVAMFPAKVVVISGGARGGKSGGGSHWGLIRALRGRSNLTNVLARSFGCMPVAGMEKWIRAN